MSCRCCNYLSQGTLNERAYTRVACHKLVHDKISKWRQEHDDWVSLAAFALSKNTGRRFKKKKKSSEDCDLDITGSVEVAKHVESLEHQMEDDESDGDDTSGEVASGKSTVSQSPSANLPTAALKTTVKATAADVQRVKQKSGTSKVTPKAKADVSPDVVVKQITLDQLSDEELFLPPADDVVDQSLEDDAAPTSTKDVKNEGDFFTAADDSECDDDQSGNGWQEMDIDDRQQESSDDEEKMESTKPVRSFSTNRNFDKHQKFGSDKKAPYSRPFASARKDDKSHHDRRKVFSDREFTKSRGHFPNTKGNSYPKNSSKTHNKFQSGRQDKEHSWRPQNTRLNLLFCSTFFADIYWHQLNRHKFVRIDFASSCFLNRVFLFSEEHCNFQLNKLVMSAQMLASHIQNISCLDQTSHSVA